MHARATCHCACAGHAGHVHPHPSHQKHLVETIGRRIGAAIGLHEDGPFVSDKVPMDGVGPDKREWTNANG